MSLSLSACTAHTINAPVHVTVMVCAVIPRVLTTTERDSVVTQLRAYALKHDVTV